MWSSSLVAFRPTREGRPIRISESPQNGLASRAELVAKKAQLFQTPRGRRRSTYPRRVFIVDSRLPPTRSKSFHAELDGVHANARKVESSQNGPSLPGGAGYHDDHEEPQATRTCSSSGRRKLKGGDLASWAPRRFNCSFGATARDEPRRATRLVSPRGRPLRSSPMASNLAAAANVERSPAWRRWPRRGPSTWGARAAWPPPIWRGKSEPVVAANRRRRHRRALRLARLAASDEARERA